MEALLGTTIPVFIGITVCLLGFAAFMTGQALGDNWLPIGQLVIYVVMLGAADRFLTFALFDGELLSVTGYLIDTAVLMVIAFFAFRLSRSRRMASQYPWLYERSGLLSWREK